MELVLDRMCSIWSTKPKFWVRTIPRYFAVSLWALVWPLILCSFDRHPSYCVICKWPYRPTFNGKYGVVDIKQEERFPFWKTGVTPPDTGVRCRMRGRFGCRADPWGGRCCLNCTHLMCWTLCVWLLSCPRSQRAFQINVKQCFFTKISKDKVILG